MSAGWGACTLRCCWARQAGGRVAVRTIPPTLVCGCLTHSCRARTKPYIASMGIYVMSAKALKELLLTRFPDANDFGNEVIPGAKDAGLKVQAYAFKGERLWVAGGAWGCGSGCSAQPNGAGACGGVREGHAARDALRRCARFSTPLRRVLGGHWYGGGLLQRQPGAGQPGHGAVQVRARGPLLGAWGEAQGGSAPWAACPAHTYVPSRLRPPRATSPLRAASTTATRPSTR